MRSIRVADTGLKPARWNVAMTSALVELHRAGRIPDMLRFHRYPFSLLIGRNSILGQEARVDRLGLQRTELARRMTDGDPIWVNPGILAFDLIADRGVANVHPGKAAHCVRSGIVNGLRRLGLPARPGSLTDIEINGHKVFEGSYCLDGPTFLFQGMVVVEAAAGVLWSARLSSKDRSAAPFSRVASIAEFLGRDSLMDETTDVLVAGLAHALPYMSAAARLGDDEIALSDRLLAEKIGTDEFVLGESLALAVASSMRRKRSFSK